jgi:hypothetical protein
MIPTRRHESLRFAALACAATIALAPSAARAGGAFAQDRTPFGANLPTTKSPCAGWGPGFESVGGSTCVKIGGRVHVEAGAGSNWRVAPSAGAATPSFNSPPAPGAPSHLRLPRRF